MCDVRADRLLATLIWMLGILFAVLGLAFLLLEDPHPAESMHRFLLPVALALGYPLLALIHWMHRIARQRARLQEATLERAGVVRYRYSTVRGGLDYSVGVKQLLGWTRAELLADPQRWPRAIHPEDARRIAPQLARLTPGELFVLEYRIQCADGGWRWLLDRAVLVEEGEGELLVEGVAIDVTVEHALRDRVEDERTRLRNLLDAIPDIVFLKDADSRYQMVNRAFAQYVGQSEARIIGLDDASLFPADRAEAVRIADKKVMHDNAAHRETQRWIDAAGAPISLDVIKQPLRDMNGNAVGVVGIARDITLQEANERERQRLLEELAGARIARAREEVADAEGRARQVMQALGEAVVGMDVHGMTTFANPAAEKLFGYTQAKLLNRSFHLLTHHTRADGSRYPASECAILRAARESADRVAVGTDLFWHHDGHSFTGEYSLLPIWKDGKPEGSVMVVRDVTAREAAAQRLEMLSRAVEDGPAGVSFTDLDGHILYVNRRFVEMTGYTEKELLGKTHRKIKSGRVSVETYRDLWQTITTGGEWVGDLLNQKKSGELFWSHTLITPLRDAQGRISHYLAIREDVTAKRELEEKERSAIDAAANAQREIAQQEERLRLMTDNVPVMIAQIDRQQRLRYCNKPYAAYFGFDRDKGVGRHLRELLGAQIFDQTEHMRLKVFAGESVHYVASRDGRARDVTMVPARDADGETVGLYAMLIDITESQRIAKELAAAKDAAEAASEAKGQFLANISHEIRTPMNAILGLSELVLRTRLDDQQRNYVEKTQRSAQLLLGLLNDVLDISKIEAGKLELEVHPFRLDDVLEQVAGLFGDTAAEKGLEFVIDTKPGLPDEVSGDSLRLTQVLSNLVSNAIKFTHDGEVVLEVALHAGVADAPTRLSVAVRDSGIGMTEAQAARAFEAFTQADGSTTRRFGGTGLGLTICRNLVQLMGGQLRIETRPGVGSRFFFDIPVDAAHPYKADATLHDVGIVVLAAHPVARGAVMHQLADLGYAAHACATPAETLAQCQALVEANTTPLLVADETLTRHPGLLEWLSHHAPRAAAGSPTLVLMLRDMRARHSSLPLAVPLVRPVTRRALRNALLAARGLAHEPVGPAPLTRPGLKDARVLVVDDYLLNVEIVSTFLSEAGCQVVSAHDGDEALRRLKESPFDVVLMDCQMPVMDGFEATRAIRRNPDWRTLPVIAMTANVTEEDRRACTECGMNDFVPKPVMIETLLDTMSRHLAGAQRPDKAMSAAVSSPSPVSPAQSTADGFERLRGIDLDAALAATMGKPDFLRKVLGIFVDTQGEFTVKFAQARESGTDPAAAKRIAHTLKGSAASIGAGALRDAAYALETACKEGRDDAEIARLLTAVAAELDPVLAGIRATLGKED